ncbi:hypothetical protein GGX14DRAFT_397553 [Mycena pura]|uniref:Uncharacterized protein n=1 Tax=Mycena pura TaxID=153505 RepID=A0AAD6V7Y7_9AGAR|nr:hypothetical protein GGX14DRAFT_397553 [Mycena pura]
MDESDGMQRNEDIRESEEDSRKLGDATGPAVAAMPVAAARLSPILRSRPGSRYGEKASPKGASSELFPDRKIETFDDPVPPASCTRTHPRYRSGCARERGAAQVTACAWRARAVHVWRSTGVRMRGERGCGGWGAGQDFFRKRHRSKESGSHAVLYGAGLGCEGARRARVKVLAVSRTLLIATLILAPVCREPDAAGSSREMMH